MGIYFKPYNGKKEYLFISYSHAKSDQVLNIISKLNDDGYRVWYDEGIPAGSNWPKMVELRLRSCKKVLFFLSKESLKSDHCYSEILTATDLGIPVLCCELDKDVPLEKKWIELLKKATYLKPDVIGENLGDNFLKSEGEAETEDEGRGRKFNWWILAVILAVLLLIVSSIAVYYYSAFSTRQALESEAVKTPVPTPHETVEVSWGDFDKLLAIEFPDTQQQKAVNSALGKDLKASVFEYELKSLTQLYFCGHTYVDNPEKISVMNDGGSYKYVIVSGNEKSSLIQGNIDNLSVISQMSYLETLYLIDQKITDISEIYDLAYLKELSIASCSSIDSLDGISGFDSLETLHIEHTDIKDLSPLTALSSLKAVTVSEEMLPVNIPSGNFEVILVK